MFKTNVSPVLIDSYFPDKSKIGILSSMEYCDVYFDTNGLVVGYRYSHD